MNKQNEYASRKQRDNLSQSKKLKAGEGYNLDIDGLGSDEDVNNDKLMNSYAKIINQKKDRKYERSNRQNCKKILFEKFDEGINYFGDFENIDDN